MAGIGKVRCQGRGLGGAGHMAWRERPQALTQQVESVRLRDCGWIVVRVLVHTAGQGHILVRAGGPGSGLGGRPGLRACSADCHSRWIRDCSLPSHLHPAPSASRAQEDCLSSCSGAWQKWKGGWKRWRWEPRAGAWGVIRFKAAEQSKALLKGRGFICVRGRRLVLSLSSLD
jgi:hypothetical protein